MIPFEELCAALDRHRGKSSAPPPPPSEHAAPEHRDDAGGATQMEMQAPQLDPAPGLPENTGEIDLDDMVDD